MNRILAGLALVCAAVPAAASEAVNMRFACSASTAAQTHSVELTGQWDMVMDVGGIPSFGLLSLGLSDKRLSGSIALNAGVAVVRSLTSDGKSVAMIVATGEGDVRFDGSLASDGRRMCGIVTYHGGQKLEMVAQRRPDRASGRRQ